MEFNRVAQLRDLVKDKYKIDVQYDWSEGSKTYFRELKKEIDEVEEELGVNRKCYLEEEFPFAIEALGWLSIVAAVVLIFMGRRNFHRLMLWALSLSKPFGRVAGVFAMAFGAFLMYAFA